MQFFRKLFTRSKKTSNRSRSFRPHVETFEAREVPHGGPLFGAHASALGDPALLGAAVAGTGTCHGDGQTQTLTATLSGATGTSGSVTFTSDAATGANSLAVQVSGLNANTAYTVLSGSTTLGTITTDNSGAGTLSVSNVSPAPAAGAAIAVMDPNGATVLSGTLAASSTSTDTGTHLKATLTGATGTSGSAHFHATATAGQNSLSVRVSGLAANATYTVQVGGTTVGTITTDANGRGRLSVSNLTTTVAAGSVVTVLDAQNATVLQGTFAAVTASHAARHHH
jgi:hypothetical protein